MSKTTPAQERDVVPARPTIHEVARRSGLSVGTVSRILNGRNKANWASTAAREEKVRKIATEIGYRANYRAHSLRSQRSHTVGLVYGTTVPILDGAYESIAQAVVSVLAKRGYQMLFVPLPQDEPQYSSMNVLDQDRIDGCIGMDPLPESVVELIRSRGLPMVSINAKVTTPRVLPDDVMGTKLAVDHLTSLGHRRIVFVHEHYEDGGHFSLDLRRSVFLSEMKRMGLASKASVLEVDAVDFVERWKAMTPAKRPTAVLVYQGTYALALQHSVWAAGVSVPKDLSVMTFDDLPALRWLMPAMTAINVPIGEIGERAAELLLAHVADRSPLPDKPVYFPETLIVRESTGKV
jgi:LacI family transcriptional regulator